MATRARLVVGVDGSPDGDRALEWALAHAPRMEAVVHALHASPLVLSVDAPPGVREEAADRSHRVLERAAQLARTAPGVEVTTEEVAVRGAEALVAASEGAVAVVVGARGHGRLAGALLGSVSQHVARHAVCPVVVVREPADRSARTIVVGVDEGPASRHAIDLALRLASAEAAPVLALHAWHDSVLDRSGGALSSRAGLAPDLRAAAVASLDAVLAPAMAARPGVVVTVDVVPGHPQRVLADASQHAALVVVGSRGRGGFAGLLLGSVSGTVLHHAHCPVAVVR